VRRTVETLLEAIVGLRKTFESSEAKVGDCVRLLCAWAIPFAAMTSHPTRPDRVLPAKSYVNTCKYIF
jgi:hypothetical protein